MSTFKKIFKDYTLHLLDNPRSLLARIYGIYTVKMENIEPVHVVLMGSTKNSNDKRLKCVFDLKGSFVNRIVRAKPG